MGKIYNHKKLEVILVITIFLAVILTVVGLSVNHLNSHNNVSNGQSLENCEILGKDYFVYIKDNTFVPDKINAKLCDSITFINQDNYRELRFGEHDDHIDYSGIREINLNNSSSQKIVLKKTGTYLIHDHLQDFVYSEFTVTK